MRVRGNSIPKIENSKTCLGYSEVPKGTPPPLAETYPETLSTSDRTCVPQLFRGREGWFVFQILFHVLSFRFLVHLTNMSLWILNVVWFFRGVQFVSYMEWKSYFSLHSSLLPEPRSMPPYKSIRSRIHSKNLLGRAVVNGGRCLELPRWEFLRAGHRLRHSAPLYPTTVWLMYVVIHSYVLLFHPSMLLGYCSVSWCVLVDSCVQLESRQRSPCEGEIRLSPLSVRIQNYLLSFK